MKRPTDVADKGLEIAAETHVIAGVRIHMRTSGPASGVPVLLLHGSHFHSGTWASLGTLTVLARAGFHAELVAFVSGL